MIQEYLLQCDVCRNQIVRKYDVDASLSLMEKIEGSSDFLPCIVCGESTYHTVIEEYQPGLDEVDYD